MPGEKCRHSPICIPAGEVHLEVISCNHVGVMSPLDFVKATLVCAAVAFVVYSYPVVSQALIIGLVALIWASYLYRAIRKCRPA